jgi:chromosome segregation ATPase
MNELEQAVVFAKGSQMIDQKSLKQFTEKIKALERKKGKWKKTKSEIKRIEEEKKIFELECLEQKQEISKLREEVRRERGIKEDLQGELRLLQKKVHRQDEEIKNFEKEVLYLEVNRGNKADNINLTKGVFRIF